MGLASVVLPMVDRNITDRGPRLTDPSSLCQPISSNEIKAALFYMDSLKAPGIDGYNALFLPENQEYHWA